MNIFDIHSHHHPAEVGSAIVQLTPDEFSPSPGQFYSIGLHPWQIGADWRAQMARIAVMALYPRVLLIGETGIDKKNGQVSMECQIEVFREHIKLSEMLHKPVVVHCVKAIDELLAVRKQMKANQPWVLHGFRGGVEQWRQLKRAGISVSIGEHYDVELVREIGLPGIILESDASCAMERVYAQVSADMQVNESDLRFHVCRNIRNVLDGGDVWPF